MTPPIALTIAGSDSGGGAGIQADLKTFQAFGCFGTSAITAITAQNTLGVNAVHPVPVEIVRAQIDALASDLTPAAFKTGMLATVDLVEVVAEGISAHQFPNFVLDPVMVASSGDRLLDQAAESTIATKLLPLARVITPNLDEASILVGFQVADEASMRRAGETLIEMGANAALIKGGHLQGEEMIDLLFDGSDWKEWRRPRRETRNTHGTGCTLSSAIAAGLAWGLDLTASVDRAIDYLQRAIEAGPEIGGGTRPVNHLVPSGMHQGSQAESG